MRWITKEEAREFARRHFEIEDNQPMGLPFFDPQLLLWLFVAAGIGLSTLVGFVVRALVQ